MKTPKRLWVLFREGSQTPLGCHRTQKAGVNHAFHCRGYSTSPFVLASYVREENKKKARKA